MRGEGGVEGGEGEGMIIEESVTSLHKNLLLCATDLRLQTIHYRLVLVA